MVVDAAADATQEPKTAEETEEPAADSVEKAEEKAE